VWVCGILFGVLLFYVNSRVVVVSPILPTIAILKSVVVRIRGCCKSVFKAIFSLCVRVAKVLYRVMIGPWAYLTDEYQWFYHDDVAGVCMPFRI
jgi:ketopantoate reductase